MQRQRKLLLLTTGAGIGGTERMAVNLTREFTAHGWHVRNVFPQIPRNQALLSWCVAEGVAAELSPALLDLVPPRTKQSMLALRRFVKGSRPDVVNIHYGGNYISLKDVLSIRAAGHHRCVATVNHPTPWDETNADKKRATKLASYLCHAIVAISQATRRVLLEAGVPDAKIHVIPCGLQVPTFMPSRAEARARLNLPASAFIVGSLARLVPEKGIADLIEAASRVPDPGGKTLLAVAGDGPERFSLESLATTRMKDRVIFLGRVADLDDFYAACDVFALPSHMEGFGLVYVEAAFHAVPSIGTDVGGVPDAVADGETGLLVSPGNVSALTAAIQRLRQDEELRLRLGRSARRRALTAFTDAAMAEQYAKVLWM